MVRHLLLASILCCTWITWANEDCPNPARFIDRGDGTVTDSESGLMWKRCVQGRSGSDCSEGSAAKFRWVEAVNEARSENFAGLDDWRVPKIDELRSIAGECSPDPAIDPLAFPGADSAEVWSASANLDFATAAWALDFATGEAAIGRRDDAKQVRLVRDGP